MGPFGAKASAVGLLGIESRSYPQESLYTTSNLSNLSPETTKESRTGKETIHQYVQDFQFEKKLQFSVSHLLKREAKRRAKTQRGSAGASHSRCTVVSHNINGTGRGLSELRHRMIEWRSRCFDQAQPDIILLQETHIGSQDQRKAVTQLWRRGWGLRQGRKCSWWSVGSSTSAGVAVLFNPLTMNSATMLHSSFWQSDRVMAIDTPRYVLINIYAPNKVSEREAFFCELGQHVKGLKKPFMLMGDWNMVEAPLVDRNYSVNRSYTTESKCLSALVTQYGLLDTKDLLQPSMSLAVDAYDHLVYGDTLHTFFRGSSSSRLDRCYITPSLVSSFRSHFVSSSAVFSDHRMLCVSFNGEEQLERGRAEQKVFPSRHLKQDHMDSIMQIVLDKVNKSLKYSSDALRVWDVGKLLLTYVLYRMAEYRKKQQRSAQHRSVTRYLRWLQTHQDDELHATASIFQKLSLFKRERIRKKEHAHCYKAMSNTYDSSSFYARYKDVRSHRIDMVDGPFHAGGAALANNMALGWQSVFSSQFKSKRKARRLMERDMNGVFDGMANRFITKDAQDLLSALITETEVRSAIRKMHTKKTPGPDLLGNELYKQYEDQLVPILVVVFNQMQLQKTCLISARTARIFPQTKIKGSTSPLHFRPISCLNGDYKLFTRILAERMKKVLGSLLGSHQHGGLPKRRLEDAIYTVQTLMEYEYGETTPPHNDPALLLLDIQKAYDTLERPFVFQVLKLFQFPDIFIDQMRALHSGTDAYFVVNGYRSEVFSISRGIRQGCPIAPLLFIVAIEVLLLKVNVTRGIEGITVGESSCPVTIKTVAFIDDTLIALKSLKMVTTVCECLTNFASLSGLSINVSKTALFPLIQNRFLTDVAGIKVIAKGEKVKYLGLFLTHSGMMKLNWSIFQQKLRAKLALFARKTSNFQSRLQLLQKVVVPSFLFLSQYVLPSVSCTRALQELVNAFFWLGYAPGYNEKIRNKLAPDLLTLPSRFGGVGVPLFEFELHNLSIRVGLRWALAPLSVNKSILDKLIIFQSRQKYAIVPLAPPKPPSLQRSKTYQRFWHLALSNLSTLIYKRAYIQNMQGKVSRIVAETERIKIIVRQTGLHVDWSIAYFDRVSFIRLQDKIIQSIPISIRGLWRFVPIHSNPFLVDSKGRRFKEKQYRNMCVDELCEVSNFSSTSGTAVLTMKLPRCQSFLKTLSLLQVFSCTLWPLPPIYTGLKNSDWSLNFSSSTICLHDCANNLTASFSSFDEYLRVQNKCNKTMYTLIPPVFPYIKFTVLGPIKHLYEDKYVAQRSRILSRYLTRPMRCQYFQSAIEKLRQRQCDWRVKEQYLQLELVKVNVFKRRWKSFHALGIENFYLKLKYNLHVLWYREYSPQVRCFYHTCNQLHANTMKHILFECSVAQKFWYWLLDFWTTSSFLFNREWIRSILVGIPFRLPIALLQILPDVWHVKHIDEIRSVTTKVWAICTQVTLMALWTIRNEVIYQTRKGCEQHTFMSIQTRIRLSLTSLIYYEKSRKLTKKGVTLQILYLFQAKLDLSWKKLSLIRPICLTTETLKSDFIGWFDGGMRCKSNRAAAGSILAKLTGSAVNIVRIQGQFLGADLTNNIAEYTALVNLLRWLVDTTSSITVFGDSKILIDQLNNHTQCRNKKLKGLLFEILTTSYRLKVRFLHTKRDKNKMADGILNVANNERIHISEDWLLEKQNRRQFTDWLSTDLSNCQVQHLLYVDTGQTTDKKLQNDHPP